MVSAVLEGNSSTMMDVILSNKYKVIILIVHDPMLFAKLVNI